MTTDPVLPEKVFITEVGPRDGLQMEKKILTTDQKVVLIGDLAAAGVKAIQVGSFVHPARTPQMADTEAVINSLKGIEKTRYSALTLNQKGVERACETAVPWIEVSFSASEAQSRNNSGMSVAQAMAQAAGMIDLARRRGRKVRGSIQCTFGCVDTCEVTPERIVGLAGLLLDNGVDLLVLADTTGMATPPAVRQMLKAVGPMCGDTPIGLHFHDTRGLGLVNLMAGLEMGVAHFDTSFGALGGCPFVQGAAGNIATEETLLLLHSLGVHTGIDPVGVARCSERISALLEHPLAGKMYRLLVGPDAAEIGACPSASVRPESGALGRDRDA